MYTAVLGVLVVEALGSVVIQAVQQLEVASDTAGTVARSALRTAACRMKYTKTSAIVSRPLGFMTTEAYEISPLFDVTYTSNLC